MVDCNKVTANTSVTTNTVYSTNVNCVGAVDGATLGGTLTTAAQPNITSVGPLTSLDVTGALSVGGISTGSITQTSGLSVLRETSVSSLTTSGNITQTAGVTSVNNLEAASFLCAGSITQNSGIATLKGIFADALIASGGIAGSTLAGTITTAAQPNITSVGTLNSLNVTDALQFGSLLSAPSMRPFGSSQTWSTGTSKQILPTFAFVPNIIHVVGSVKCTATAIPSIMLVRNDGVTQTTTYQGTTSTTYSTLTVTQWGSTRGIDLYPSTVTANVLVNFNVVLTRITDLKYFIRLDCNLAGALNGSIGCGIFTFGSGSLGGVDIRVSANGMTTGCSADIIYY